MSLRKEEVMRHKRELFMTSVVFGLVLAACSPVVTSPTATNTPVPATDTAAPAEAATPTPDLAPANTPIVEPALMVDISIKGFAFSPADVTVAAGTTVRWTNEDSSPHSIKAADGSWTSPSFGKGETYEKVFDTPGTYEYICGLHPTMKGRIVVT